MDFGKAFTFPFEDTDWLKKIAIIAVILIIPILGGLIAMGWSIDITRRVIRRDTTPLPDLDFGRHLVDGFKLFVIGLVYSLPILILTLPILIVSFGAGEMDENVAATLVSLVSLCCGGLIVIYSLLMMVVLPAAYGRFAATDSLSSAFGFSEILALVRAAPGAYLLVLVGVLLTGIIAQLGTILCIIGVVATLAYSFAVNGHLYGQAYNEATGNRGFAQVY
jgi:hypothetical protein